MQNRLAAYLVLSCAAVGFTLATSAVPAIGSDQAAKAADTSTAKPPSDAATNPDCASQVWPHLSSVCLRGVSSHVNVRQVQLTTASRP